MTGKESAFACDLTAIAADQRDAHLATIDKLFRAVESIRELPNGYSVRLPNESEVLLTAAEFIALERLCCPFFDFGLEIERGWRSPVESHRARRCEAVYHGRNR